VLVRRCPEPQTIMSFEGRLSGSTIGCNSDRSSGITRGMSATASELGCKHSLTVLHADIATVRRFALGRAGMHGVMTHNRRGNQQLVEPPTRSSSTQQGLGLPPQ
jgi:hypothetical protein